MKKYFIEYAGKSKEVVASSYRFLDDLMFFYVGEKAIFAVNKNLIESVSVHIEEIDYNDIDLSKLITDHFLTELRIEDSTLGDADSYRIGLDIILGVNNKITQFGNYNKNFYPTIKEAKNKLIRDLIYDAIKTYLKEKLNN
jgi:hypothetical protein